MKKIIIAIDGYSSCGKSTLAKDLASTLGYAYLDSGAMYRAVTLYFLRNNIDVNNIKDVVDALEYVNINFNCSDDGINTTILNGEDVESEIRQMNVSSKVSEVAALSEVRKKLVEEQRKMGDGKGIVMDGRDIGTVVFPHAELKLFITADLDTRVDRRYSELKAKNYNIDRDTIKKNLLERDHIDSTRSDSPLKKAEDALILDNTNLNRREQLNEALLHVNSLTS